MVTAGYFKLNTRALSLRGRIRMSGWPRALLGYLLSFNSVPRPSGWMPQLWADSECAQTDLSARFFEVAEPYRVSFKKLGFTEIGFKRIYQTLDPVRRDNGGICLLDESKCHFGQIVYSRAFSPKHPNQERETIVFSLTTSFGENSLSYTNWLKMPFSDPPNHKVVRMRSEDVSFVYQRFLDGIRRSKRQPQSFIDMASLRNWCDNQAEVVLEDRIRKGYFIRMTDAEATAAKLRLPPPLPS